MTNKNNTGLFARKQINTDLFKKTGLEKSLSAFGLTMMGVGAVVGSGIFITPGIIAATKAGPGVTLSFLLAAVVCALAALCYSEFSSTIPLAGSAYTYIYAVFGELLAWVLGWALISEYLFAVSSVAVAWSAYFQNLLAGFGLKLPEFLQASFGTVGAPHAGINLIAIIVTLLVSYFLTKGVRESARVNNIMVIIKIAVILLFVLAAVRFVKPANYNPFLPFGGLGVLSGAAVAFYAYIGFDAVSAASEEVKNPKRDMPIGIVSSLIISSILYIGLATVLVGVVNYKHLNVADPVAMALALTHQNWLAGIVSLGAVVGMTTVLLVMSYGGTRLIFAISRDGLLPKSLHKLNPKTHVPVANTWIFGVVGAIFAGLIPLDKIAELVNIGTLFAFSLVSIGVVFLRQDPEFKDLPRAFEVPFYPVLPIISFICCVGLMLLLRPITWGAFLLWQIVGLLIYGFYGYRNSKLRTK
ncbi:APC family permease [Pediococcus argentinicus]|uniref:Amino acid transporter n=1 Tax=Pediococcus argentinicus TaxID=480391 RepID=A0A0R2NE19_9LACO|nr:amino acid permease [Pediococcus argentinicus]KRO24072.1 amino acid transporter [Pediococcus argentinicus]NKZ22522.1 amino acid permease [Pediococcus argentinicus]GEP19876.1 amino acid permease [Pediococcus argentinicus]